MKRNNGLKTLLIVLCVLLISVISFVGLYAVQKNEVNNLLPDYKLGMDLKGSRVVTVTPNLTSQTVYYDKDGNEVTEEVKDGSKKEIPVNEKELLTEENYKKAKEIIEARLKAAGIPEFLVRFNESTGAITVQMEENSVKDLATQYMYSQGLFTVEDEDGNVLLNNDDVKISQVNYSTTENGTTVYLNVQMNKESVEKLREISKTYVQTTNEEGETVTKSITIKIDGQELKTSSFGSEITNGVLSIPLTTSTDTDTLNEALQMGSNIAILINYGKVPVKYTLEQSKYLSSQVDLNNFMIVVYACIAAILVITVVLVVIYKKKGLLVGIANIGYFALLLLAIRYANVVLTIEGIFAIGASVILNYIFSIELLKCLKEADIKQATLKKVLDVLIIFVPAIVIAITFCFARWLSIYSFGQVAFWGILLSAIYNLAITRTLLIYNTKKQ